VSRKTPRARSATAAATGTIKRYDNRKLYDPAAKRYVTMADLASRVARGEELRIEDKAGSDITTVVLAQALLEAVKRRTADVPRQVFARLLRLGSSPSLLPAPAPDLAARARDDAERIVSRLLARGRLSLEEAVSLRQEIAASLQGLVADLQRNVESRIHGLLSHTTATHTQASLDTLRERLLAFETYLAAPPKRSMRSRRR
jgi:polyhydroxyalkanoate synthesis regulator phasin